MATTPQSLAAIPVSGAARAGLTWRAGAIAAAAAIAWVVLCLYATAAAMVSIWARSDTFMHGFLIAPISLWLVWRMRDQLASIVPRPSYATLILVAGAGLVWSAGLLGASDVVSQFALVAMVALAVPALLGWKVASAMAFPLAFLFFMVPFGEFLLPQLMDWTAGVTVAAVRASGVPVYQDGLQFVLPSGRWSVVEACSGVRYLMATLVAGSLYAYLSYQSPRRRATFMAVSIVVPVVANWVRAYLIVMLGHLSNNTLAVGVDHLIYGWLFFGVVLLLLFWVGSFWREADPAHAPSAMPGSVDLPRSAHGFAGALPALAAFAVVVVAWPLAARAFLGNGNHGQPELAAVEPPARWIPSAGGLTDWTPRFVGAAATSHTRFEQGQARVGLYIAYYRNQAEGRKVVSTENVLAVSEDPKFTVRSSAIVGPSSTQAPMDVRESIVKRADGSELVTWQWYWVDGHATASDALAKLYGLRMRLGGRGDDGAIVVASVRAETVEQARGNLAAFVRDAFPAIERALERTRAGR